MLRLHGIGAHKIDRMLIRAEGKNTLERLTQSLSSWFDENRHNGKLQEASSNHCRSCSFDRPRHFNCGNCSDQLVQLWIWISNKKSGTLQASQGWGRLQSVRPFLVLWRSDRRLQGVWLRGVWWEWEQILFRGRMERRLPLTQRVRHQRWTCWGLWTKWQLSSWSESTL